MRAIVCRGYGRPSVVLRPDEINEPALGHDQVLVDVHAAALNPADWHLIRGVPYLARLQVGFRRPSFEVPGSDFAGCVVAVGSAATALRPGDEVYGTTFMAGFGAFAERVVVPERLLTRRPQSVSFQEAAAVPLAGSTALQALRDLGKLQRGQKVLIIGASGGVGTYAVQLAKHFGAAVTAVCSTPNIELVRTLGADHVIDYTTQAITETPDRYDLILQAAGTHPASRLRRVLTPTGTLVQISGDSPNHWVGPLGRILAGRLLSLFVGQTITSFTVRPNREDLEFLAALIEKGVLRTHVDRTYGLDDLPEALERLESGRTRGKVAVAVKPWSNSGEVDAGHARSGSGVRSLGVGAAGAAGMSFFGSQCDSPGPKRGEGPMSHQGA
jgi:NADPH:quinone reductase-like Zn-dependent oxidoreductase